MPHPEIQPFDRDSATHPAVARRPAEQVEWERAQIAEQHVHDSNSVAPSRADQPRVLLRSPLMWGLVYLPTLVLLAVLGYMASHLHEGDPGRVPGAGDRDSPNAQPGDK